MAGTVELEHLGAAGPVRPTVRVLPVPRLEPPSDDELRAAGIEPPSLDAPLLPFEMPGVAGVRKRSSGRSARGNQPTGMSPLDPGPIEPTPSAIPAEPQPVAPPSPCRNALMRFLAVVFEVADGFRPVGQLRGLCRPDRFDSICAEITGKHPTLAGLRSRAGGFVPPRPSIGAGRPAMVGRTPTGAPPRTGRVAPRGPAGRITVRHLQICDVNDSVAEVSVVLGRGGLVWAVAGRMELINGRWLCVHLEII